ncbi:ABC transporter ATP-binding protein [Rhodohalobacter mucosus]|uniref:Copper ABC transporter ATP-binding protein n=1 Tax=Rhodohalobacter mucosus TaxID=2079485 RepID=A0A316U3G4_9BACT|nr:ABC transporter ATP-binding protein [Rhodohalobacter mucosus]PWN07986.1 copper ABC transporter ATP-binding protein [Rhodohalobacter mucosus]
MIYVNNLKKAFGSQQVLKGLNLTIPEGQSTGIVGPNGAGKTTLIKTMLGLVKADSGDITINNIRLNGNYEYRRNIGYMPQQARYPEQMAVNDLFGLMQHLRGEDPVYLDELIEEFDLNKELQKSLRALSGGNRQKVGAAIAMMFNPSILFFDEPTAGLDPRSSYIFKERIQKEKESGKTVLITSHIMSELEQLVDHVVFILEGEIKYYGRIDDLLKENRQERLEGAIAKLMEEPGS